jgi:steroid delta-isomerase-like uncharacterized protein
VTIRTTSRHLVEALFEAHNSRDWNRFFSFYSQEFVLHAPGREGPLRGREAFRDATLAFALAVPDLHAELVRTIIQEPWICVEYVLSGTKRSNCQAREGQDEIARTFRVSMCSLFRVDDGLIVEERAYYDRRTFGE